jgi:TPR repeat protein
MRRLLLKVLLGTGLVCAVGFAGVGLYQSKLGLGLRAQLGQNSGQFLYALRLYQDNDIAAALRVIEPLVADGHGPSLNLVCGFVNDYAPVAPTAVECVRVLQNQPVQRLTSLTDIAIWAQEWDVAANLLNTRLANGDQTAHFDRARLIFAAPQGRFDANDLSKSLELANAAQDPRGQYAAVVQALNVTSGGALSPVLTEMLGRRPKLRASDAYFELAKLIQTGAVSSDLSYVEVLRRANATGNENAARYLAQYYMSNPALDPTGAERQKWTEAAAAANDPVAQYNRAVTILSSPDAGKPMGDAIALLDRSAAAGFVPAMNMLGATLWQNPALLPRPASEVQAQALGLMQAAAAKDDLNALFNLGNIYLAQQDRPKALEYLQKGASLGSQPARDLLESIGEATD